MAIDSDARIKALEEEVKRIRELLMQITLSTGTENTAHDHFDLDGFTATLSQVLQHCSQGLPGQEVNRAGLRIGATSLHGITETGDVGPMGFSKGIGGEIVSHYDNIPPGAIVEIP